LPVLLTVPPLEIPLLPLDDAIAHEQQRGHEGKEHPSHPKEEPQAAHYQSLTKVVRIAAQAIRAFDHETADLPPRRDRCPRSPKVVYHRAAEGETTEDEAAAQDSTHVAVGKKRKRPQALKAQAQPQCS
jgi:hypothetical protein